MSLADKPCDAPLKVWGEAVQGDKGGGRRRRLEKYGRQTFRQGQTAGFLVSPAASRPAFLLGPKDGRIAYSRPVCHLPCAGLTGKNVRSAGFVFPHHESDNGNRTNLVTEIRFSRRRNISVGHRRP